MCFAVFCFNFNSQKTTLRPIPSKFGPQEVNRFSQLCAQFQPPGSLSFTQRFSKTRNMAADVRCNLWLFLRRMKACIDEFQPNTSQGNYFEGFWRIPSKTNKIEVRKQFESCGPIADSSQSAAHVVETQRIPSRLRLACYLQILAYFDELYQQIHVCLSLTSL